MWTQPGTQQRPKPFNRVDMNFVKTIVIFIAGIFTRRVIDTFVLVAPLLQAVINVVFISINQTASLNHFRHERLNGHLLDIRQHLDHNFAIALNHAQNWRFFFCQRTASTLSFQFSPSACAIFARHNGWMPFVTSRNVNFIRFDFAAQLDWLFLAMIPARN